MRLPLLIILEPFNASATLLLVMCCYYGLVLKKEKTLPMVVMFNVNFSCTKQLN